MATQRRSSKSTAKKLAKPSSARKRASLKTSPDRRKRSMSRSASSSSSAHTASTLSPKSRSSSPSSRATSSMARTARRGGGAIKRAIKKGISELAKVGS